MTNRTRVVEFNRGGGWPSVESSRVPENVWIAILASGFGIRGEAFRLIVWLL